MGDRHVGRDGIDDIDIEADRRVDQPDLHVDGQDHAEPDRIEAGGRKNRVQDRCRHQDDGRRWNEEAANEQKNIDEEHQHPSVDVHVGDRQRQCLGQIKRGQHVAEQHGRRDDRQDHHRLAGGIAQDQPPFLRRPHAIDEDSEQDA